MHFKSESVQSMFNALKKVAWQEVIKKFGVTKAMGFDPSLASSSIFNQLCVFYPSDMGS